MIKKSSESLKRILQNQSYETCVEKPCKIINVHTQNLVDVEYYDDYKTDVLYKVPVKHIQTKNAYIFIKLKVGDYGTVRFFDNDTNYYRKGSKEYDLKTRTHNINDGIFSIGFFPSNENIIFPEDDIVIKSGDATISFNGGDITISGGKTYIQGVDFLSHTHIAGDTETTGVVI